MTKKERELRQLLKTKREAAEKAIEEGKNEEARSLMDEAKGIKNQIDLLIEARELDAPDTKERDFVPEKERKPQEDKEEQREFIATKEYRQAWFKVLTGKEDDLSQEERGMLQKVIKENRQLSAGSDKDGGYTVPEDISREILKSIHEMNTVRNLVTVVPKNTSYGNYTVRKGVAQKLYNTAEKEQIKELKNMEFDQITWNIKKFAGFLPISSELLDDSFLNFTREIIDWLSESALTTENDEIFYGKGDENVEGLLTNDKFKKIDAPNEITIKFLRRVKNSIVQGYRRNAVWVMNTEAFETLANIEDKNGRGILAADPRNEDAFNLFGRPVHVYDEIVTDDETKTTQILFGDIKRCYRMFDRKRFEIKSTDVGADAFLTDQTYFRGIERFDGRIVDPEGVVIVEGLKVAEGEEVTP
ncbi:phage capsid protein [Shouchella clausii]|uniref:phage major capsid protein n=1 Tax=Shouchella clausii TaxID=79880 RepID=UPI000BA5B6E1|nr:phage major capsid protein [Shouchella clausii]PAD46651.1 phage major capsid protein [Shouchella clausii]GIN17454.1 phage capsid protein [Shouchella clausii]